MVEGLYFMILLSGSVFCAARFHIKTEKSLPITIMAIVLVLFAFGLCGKLLWGVYAVILAAFGLYITAAGYLIRNRKGGKLFAKNFFTSGFGIFTLFFVGLIVMNWGRVFSKYDEFTHWGTVVKAMVYVDDFGTNQAANVMFRSYPPGMALFQYFLQKLQNLIYGKTLLVEWRMYFSYQLFLVAVLMPFFEGIGFRKPLRLVVLSGTLFAFPNLICWQYYDSILIDPALGFLSGGGMAFVFLRKQMCWEDNVYVCLLCGMLMLMKDVGLLLAIFLALAYGIRFLQSEPGMQKKSIIWAFAALMLPIVLKGLWSLEIYCSSVFVAFNGKIDLVDLFRVLTGGGEAYRREVLIRYCNELSMLSYRFGPVSLNCLQLILIMAVFCVIAWKIQEKRNQSHTHQKWILLLAFLQCIIFVGGMCVVYMYKFSKEEALALAEMARYISIEMLAYWLMLSLIGLHLISESKEWVDVKEGIVLICLILCTPLTDIYALFLGQKNVNIERRHRYMELGEQIVNVCDGKDRIALVHQDTTLYDFYVIEYNSLPNTVESVSNIGMGEIGTDPLPNALSAEQWQEELVAKYDYLAVFELNEYFYENYAALFENPDEIAENRVYLVNPVTGLLELCVQ